uniref:CRAL-TRIO domain-containing protein n=1 Tax=Auxenochlorella protothecoides TaxID=3075 RepID=A0A1D2A6B2_AUXPR
MVMRPPGASPGADSQRLCAWILDAALAALPPGQECVLGIFDLKGFSLQNADLGFARFLVDALFTYYPRRLGQAVLVDPPWAFQPGWSVVKPWLGKYGDLVRVCSARQVGVEYFQPGTAPSGFGPS